MKVFRDPIHGNVLIPWPFLLELVDHPSFQRLRRIRQLGMGFTTYHGAEHSRFQHALGAMWLMHRILASWKSRRLCAVSVDEEKAACAAALLHDVGHGPFSHALERVFSGVDHEALGRRIVRERLAGVLERRGVDPDTVLAMMGGTYPRPVFCELIASQLDVDRMDYLQRDSLYTGVKYGLFDVERILHTLVPIGDPEVAAVDPKGTEAVEEYLFSRYFMHWQVYLHRTVRASEVLLRVVLQRARHVYRRDPEAVTLPPNMRFLFAGVDPASEEFLSGFLDLDDFDVFHAIKLWRQSPDPILADLARRFLERRPFKALSRPASEEALQRACQAARERLGDDWSWYVHEDTPSDLGFGLYEPGGGKTPIRVLAGPGQWREISEVTRTDAILSLSRQVSQPYLMVAEECRREVEEALRGTGVP